MKTLRHFVYIVGLNTAIVPILSMLCTFLCRKMDFIFHIPTNVIGLAVIFPLVFSIASAYKRREDALKSFAVFKSSLASLYLAYHNCVYSEGKPPKENLHLIYRLLSNLAVCLQSSETKQEQASQEIYQTFRLFSHMHKEMLQCNVPVPYVTAANAFLHSAITSFEQMKNIACYHTPSALRAYSRIFLMAFPIIFSPYFAGIDLADSHTSGYFVAVVYSIVLVSLDNIQDHLENPYDGIGLDDLHLNVANEYTALISGTSMGEYYTSKKE
ncbi:MAG: hypothetical protein AAF320_05970 [Myxococcota bacterium]